MEIKLEYQVNQQAEKELEEAIKRALQTTAERMLDYKLASGEIPKKTGALEDSHYVDSSLLSQGSVGIVSDMPYAGRLYFHPEFDFSKEFNPNAKGLWWEDFITGGNKSLPFEWFSESLTNELSKKE